MTKGNMSIEDAAVKICNNANFPTYSWQGRYSHEIVGKINLFPDKLSPSRLSYLSQDETRMYNIAFKNGFDKEEANKIILKFLEDSAARSIEEHKRDTY